MPDDVIPEADTFRCKRSKLFLTAENFTYVVRGKLCLLPANSRRMADRVRAHQQTDLCLLVRIIVLDIRQQLEYVVLQNNDFLGQFSRQSLVVPILGGAL